MFRRDCSACHTLTGHDTQAAGGDLAQSRLSRSVLASLVRTMPVRLTKPELDAVVAYVRAAATRSR